MLPAISICCILLLQSPINTSPLYHEFGLQDGVLQRGISAKYAQPQGKTIFEPQPRYDSTQPLNNVLGLRNENKQQNNLETVIDLLKKIATTTVAQPLRVPDFRLENAKLAQFAKILQRNDDSSQATGAAILNSQAYLSIIQKLLQRLDINMTPVNKSNMRLDKVWNNNVLAQYTDKIFEDLNDNDEHMIINSLRLLLRSLDKNMGLLDKHYHLVRRTVDDKKKLAGMNIRSDI